MSAYEHADRLWANLMDLGAKRLLALAIVGLAVVLTIGLGAYYLSRPQLEVLYSGLKREDVTRIGSTLTDAGIGFDVNAGGDAILVRHAQTAKARMLLAEKGLPHSTTSGYELFDNLGSLGITSFMQEVTRVRALEGEIARTIQAMRGIKAARVHIVLADPGSFRREQRPPSASVVIRAETADTGASAQAIRHLVAAAVPGLSTDKVTVLSTDGRVLASGDDGANAATGRLALLQQTVNRDIQENVRRTLTPYLGLDNFEVSVSARLNTDKRVVNQTIFDPESRVERSVRVVRETENSQNRSRQTPTTVQQNLPTERVSADGGENSSEESQKREELTNFEISSKQIQTSSDGFAVEHLSLAVLVNRARLAGPLGAEASEDAIARQITEIEQLVASAAGLQTVRGDTLKVSAVPFMEGGGSIAPAPELGIVESLLRQSGNLVNAVTIFAIAALLVWFGLRPVLSAILERPEPAMATAALAGMEGLPAMEAPEAVAQIPGHRPEVNLIEDLRTNLNNVTIKRLEQLVERNEEQAVHILKQWMHAREAA